MNWSHVRKMVEPYGDLASVIGLIISFIGLFITGWTLWKVKTTEKIVEENRKETREAIGKFQGKLLVNILTSVFRSLREIESARDKKRWAEAHEYCVQVRSELCEITKHPNFSEIDREQILSNIDQLGKMQLTLEKLKTPAATDKMSRDVLKQLQELISSIGKIKSGIEAAISEIIT